MNHYASLQSSFMNMSYILAFDVRLNDKLQRHTISLPNSIDHVAVGPQGPVARYCSLFCSIV